MKKHYYQVFKKTIFFFYQSRLKKLILLFYILIFILIWQTDVQGQQYVPFPSSNAIWSEVFTSYQPDEIETYQYGIEGDTVYNNIQYSKLYLLNDTVYPLSVGRYCGGIREDDMKRIYIIDCDYVTFPIGDDEVILYDFSKSVGDTVFVGNDGYGPMGYLMIEEIDSVLIDGNYRKRFNFGLEEWIEGIGSTRGLLSPITAQPTGFQYWELICFNQDDEVIYLNPEYNTCFPILTAINDMKPVNNIIKIFPHPITNISVIDLAAIADCLYQYIDFYNVFGQKVNRINIADSEQIIISKLNYKSGLYVYRISGQNMKPLTGKIIFE